MKKGEPIIPTSRMGSLKKRNNQGLSNTFNEDSESDDDSEENYITAQEIEELNRI